MSGKSSSRSAREHAQKIVEHAKKASTRAKKMTKKKSTKNKAKDTSQQLHSYAYKGTSSKRRTRRDARARKKAEYLATLPKSRWKRILYRLRPDRFFKYWFSRQGRITALKLAGAGLVVGIIFVGVVFAYFRRDLDVLDVNRRQLDQTTKFYDSTGEHLLFELYGDQNRTIVEFDQISKHLKDATIAIEDKDFYNHGGFSFTGYARAAIGYLTHKGAIQGGGSTITQQFIKNSLLTQEQTFTRKIKELILSIELERLYSKDEILAFYLNEISYGGQAFGIEAASESYFAKPASELTLDESAMLAGLPQRPTYLSPYGENTEALVARQHTILDLMREQGYISIEESDAAKEVDTLAKIIPLEEQSLYKNIRAPHFVLEVQKQLEEKYGASVLANSGYKIITSLNMSHQTIAEEAVASGVGLLDDIGADNIAFASTDVVTGQVTSMVGSRDFRYPGYGSFNAATALRQPGSSFKPYVYSELLKSDSWGPGSNIYDVKTDFGNYSPNNADRRFHGTLSIRQALARSRNIPAVKALYISGVESSINQAERMGINTLRSPDNYGLSLVLGAGEVKLAEHVHAYSGFARGGNYLPQTYVLKITDPNGETIEEWTQPTPESVLDPQIAYLISDMLADVPRRLELYGSSNARSVSVPGLTYAMKTGTTDESRDGWMMGYSTRISAGVWTGNSNNEPMTNGNAWRATGATLTEFMRRVHEGLPDENFARPEGIKTVTIDTDTGRQATDKSANKRTDIFPSWYKPATTDTEKKTVIDKISGKRATECTPERAKEEVVDVGRLPEIPPEDPAFSAWAGPAGYGKTSTITEDDDVHKCSDSLPKVSVNTSKLDDGIYSLKATVTRGTHSLATLNFIVDDQIVSSQNISSNGTYSYTHIFSSTGSHTVRAEVVDSVLYDNSNSSTVSVSSVYDTTSLVITSPSNGGSDSGPGVTVKWTNDSAADEYKLCYRRASTPYVCVNDNNNTHNLTLLNGQYNAYVEAYLDSTKLQTSPTITFNVN